MSAMDGIRSFKALPYHVPAPYYLPVSAVAAAFAPPFSTGGVSVLPFVDSADFEGSHNSRYGFSKSLGESHSEPFSRLLGGFGQGYSRFQFIDPLSSQMTRATSPDWPFHDNLSTRPCEIEHPHQTPRGWNQLSNKGRVNGSNDNGAYHLSTIKEAWNINECNPAIYPSFCNRAPAAHSSVFGSYYDPLHPVVIDEIEESLIASCLEGPKDFHVELAEYGRESCEISTKNEVQNEIGSQGFTGLFTNFPGAHSVSQECNSGGGVIGGRSCDGKQVTEENQFMSQNQNSLCGCRYVGGFNASGCLETRLTQEAENGLPSTSFTAAAPEKAPASKLDVQLLVQTMHNMSELLLGHCSTNEFQLNELDRSMLGNVITNIRTCTLVKDAQRMIPAQKCLFPELGPGNLGGQSPQLQQAMRSAFGENFFEEDESASHTKIWSEVQADEAYSVFYGAPFNQTMEVENYSSKPGGYLNALVNGEQSMAEADLKLSPDQNSREEVNSYRSAEHISAIHAPIDSEEPCCFELSADLIELIPSENAGEGTQKADDSTVFGTNREAEHDETNQEDVPNSGDSHALYMAGEEGTEDDSLNAETQDSSGDIDDEESDFDSDETLDSSGYTGQEETGLDWEEDEEMQPASGPRIGFEHVSSDDSSSDWEVVVKESIE